MERQSVKLSLCLTKYHATKTYGGGSGRIAPQILNLGIRADSQFVESLPLIRCDSENCFIFKGEFLLVDINVDTG
jgi:hypothetical protein